MASQVGDLLLKWLKRQQYFSRFTTRHLWKNVLGFTCSREAVYYHVNKFRDDGMVERCPGPYGVGSEWRVLINENGVERK